MKQINKLTITVLLTVLFIPGLFAQSGDSSILFNGLDVSLTCNQTIINKDFKTGIRTTRNEDFDIYGISSLVIKNDVLQIPEDKRNLKIKDITYLRISKGRNYNSVLIGAGIGFVVGLIAGLEYAVNAEKGFIMNTGPIYGFLIGTGFTITGGIIGLIAAPMEYEEYNLRKYNESAKRQKIIETLNKNKVPGL
jgi:hypothetical protein